MTSCYRKNEKGFTLLELFFVMVVLATISAIAVGRYQKLEEDANRSLLKSNTAVLCTLFTAKSIEYPKSAWYGPWDENGNRTLNNFMELELAAGAEPFVNPFSKNVSVLDYTGTMNSGDGWRPAVFMTANSSYAYDGEGDTEDIIGSVVVCFKVDSGETEYIELYYVNHDGTKSDYILHIK